MELGSKVVIVTGAANGLGRALALGFAQRGAHVVVADIDGDGADATAREIGGLGVGADLGRIDEVAPQRHVSRLGRTRTAPRVARAGRRLPVPNGLDSGTDAQHLRRPIRHDEARRAVSSALWWCGR